VFMQREVFRFDVAVVVLVDAVRPVTQLDVMVVASGQQQGVLDRLTQMDIVVIVVVVATAVAVVVEVERQLMVVALGLFLGVVDVVGETTFTEILRQFILDVVVAHFVAIVVVIVVDRWR